MYSANVGGMRGMGSGGMQVPQMSMMGMMGNGGFLPFNQGMIANQMMMPGMQANMMPGMQTGIIPGIQAGMMPGMQASFVPGMHTGMMPGMMPPTMQTGMGMMPMNNYTATDSGMKNQVVPPLAPNPSIPSPAVDGQDHTVPPPAVAPQPAVTQPSMSQPMAESPRRPSAQERRSLPPRRFEASLEALERDGVISPTERVRVHGGLIAPMNAARRQACSSGALSALECGSGVVVRGRGRLDGASFFGGDGDVGLSGGGASGGSGERYGLSGGGETSAVGRFSTDAMPLPPISVPVSALLSGAGGSFRLTDVFGRTPRPAAIAGNGNSGLMYPLIGSAVVTSPFGWRLHPVMGTWLMHAGRDLAAPEGTPVVAALHGRVVSSGLAGGYGLAIEIEHDGPRRRTLYGHLSELYVKEGQEVRQGEVIGRVGSTGLSTGPHLHFEVRMPQEGGWVAVDPGELDPGGAMAMITSQPGQPGQPGAVPIDAVALLMGELIQTLERPRSPLALPGAADPSLGQPSPAPAPNPKG